jgi:hypothetical protein
MEHQVVATGDVTDVDNFFRGSQLVHEVVDDPLPVTLHGHKHDDRDGHSISSALPVPPPHSAANGLTDLKPALCPNPCGCGSVLMSRGPYQQRLRSGTSSASLASSFRGRGYLRTIDSVAQTARHHCGRQAGEC